jgi:glycosyltransferase involved in cell wall biosynthesis
MSGERLRVLVIGAWFPYPPQWGWATRVYHLSRQLARRNDVTLLTYAARNDLANVPGLERELRVVTVPREQPSTMQRRTTQAVSLFSNVPYEPYATRSRAMQEAIHDLLEAARFDVIQLESTLVWPFRFPTGAKLVIDEHNIDYETYGRMRDDARSPVRRLFYSVEEARVRRYVQDAWRRAAGCVVTSDREDAIVRRNAPHTPTAVVANGVDVDYFKPGAQAVDPDLIVFNGAIDYRPNLDAAQFLVDEVLPRVHARRPGAHIAIVGRGGDGELAALRRDAVEVTGVVPDVRPYLERAAVVAVPIRAGSGTRFKVVEGLAMARPMVSTAVGCEGIGVEDGRHLLIAEDPRAFADAILRLLEDPVRAAQLGREGRALVEREFSWERAGERLEDLHRRVVAR